MDYTTTVEIASDADTVWTALSDPEQWLHWKKDVTAVEPKGTGPHPSYGAQYKVKQAWWKLDNQELQIRDFQPRQRVVFGLSSTSGEFSLEYTIRELPDRRVAVDHLLRTTDAGSALSGLLAGGTLQKQLVKEATQLRDYCEQANPQDVVPPR